MIAAIDTSRCTGCNLCVEVCPTLVLDATDAVPVIARLAACQTCYLCEVYCPAGAIHVGADQFAPEPASFVTPDRLRRDHGWDEPRGAGQLDDYRRLGPLLNAGVEIAARRQAGPL